MNLEIEEIETGEETEEETKMREEKELDHQRQRHSRLESRHSQRDEDSCKDG